MENIEIPQILLNSEYWIELRKMILSPDVFGEGDCDKWSTKTYRLLEKEGLTEFVEAVRLSNQRVPELKNNYLKFHKWLEVRDDGERIFLADGTAGQIFPSYPLGFYGTLEEIPLRMKEFYNYGTKIDTPSRLFSPKRIKEYSPVFFR